MNKNDVDTIVLKLMKETKESERIFSKKELKERFHSQYSKDQIERIYYRYKYLGNFKV